MKGYPDMFVLRSQGGSAFFAGKGVANGSQEASMLKENKLSLRSVGGLNEPTQVLGALWPLQTTSGR